jgi:sulfite oxidase
MSYQKHPRFITRQTEPLNGGTPADVLRESLITPQDAFYVRSHGSLPIVDRDRYRLIVNGLVDQALSLSLNDLKTGFPKRELMATLQCAGNRRKELAEVAPLAEGSVMWDTEAISTAIWGGVGLADVMEAAGIDLMPDTILKHHVAFSGLDVIRKGDQKMHYGGSIPLEKALDPCVLLAYEMNGEPLPALHGYPLRVVVPGYIAARSVKWLSTITVQTQSSENHFQQKDYKLFPKEVTPETVDWSQGEPLNAMRTDAVICVPENGAQLPTGRLIVKGYAIPAENSAITAVEVSCNHGFTWHRARLLNEHHDHVWRFWEIECDFPPGEHCLMVRAHDLADTVQPSDAADLWNFRGYMNNSVHQVRVYVTQPESYQTEF